ncbi:MAG: hypothetical protein ACXVGR_12240 [Mycobacteriaceae bacterium]
MHQPRATVVLVGDREHDVHAAGTRGSTQQSATGLTQTSSAPGPHLATDATDVERIVLAT